MSHLVPSSPPTTLDEPPLVVDLDGTLIRSDTLVESFFLGLGTRPIQTLKALLALAGGKASLKAALAEVALPDAASLPLDPQVQALLAAERARGRQIYLASAADRRIVEAVAAVHGPFDGIFASSGDTNLSGIAKAAALVNTFGERGFDYLGNEAADIPVWNRARAVLLADATPALVRFLLARYPGTRIVSERQTSLLSYLRALRLHQWAKNLLLFVPAIAAHRTGLSDLAVCLLGFLSFGLVASSVYVANDLIDLANDRAHSTKRARPLAAGSVPLLHGVLMMCALFGAGLLLALTVGPAFLTVLLCYSAGTVAYSLVLKRKMLIDVIALASLYGLRLYAGAAALDVTFSTWLGTFALFIFTCLALVKRCAELMGQQVASHNRPLGREYCIGDLPVLQAMAAASGFTAVLVIALYADSDTVAALYAMPQLLHLICVVLLYWICRILMLTHRGQMNEDPVVFALTDRVSLACALVCLGIVLASA